MSYHVMPFIYLNMGGELIYILNYRLNKQSIDKAKGVRVLRDVVETLLNKKFLEMMFEPQMVYSRDSLRHMFEQIANSSVMRLTNGSMDQLFELMVMPVKYQTLLCKDPSELVLVTLNHLNGIKECFDNPTPVFEPIEYAQMLFMDNFVATPLWEMASIRSTILNFFLGSQTKVTRLVDERRQLEDGRFVLFSERNGVEEGDCRLEIELPYGAMAPGTVRYTVGGSPLRVKTFPVPEKFRLVLEHQERTVSRGTVLGQNMFKMIHDDQKNESFNNASLALGGGRDVGGEVQLLSHLLSGKDGVGDEVQTFNLSLFEDDILPATSSESMPDVQPAASTVTKQPGRKKKSLSGVMKELTTDEPRGASCSQSRSRGAELLKMMDEAANETPPPPPPATAARRRTPSAKQTPKPN